MRRTFTVAELAEAVGARIVGDGSRRISGLSTLVDAGPDDLAFIESDRYRTRLLTTSAGAVLMPESLTPPAHVVGLCVGKPSLAMAQAVALMVPVSRTFSTVSPQAVIGAGVSLAEDVGVGPGAFVGDGTSIGRGTEIHPGVTVAARVVIGDDCVLHSGVHVYPDTIIGNRVTLHSGAVIGADGFGYLREPLPPGEAHGPFRHRKIRHVGCVVIEDDVEVGANSTIDRAALAETRIGRGTKIDNLVMIGHNARVGRHCVIIGQAGISGSTTIGDCVTIAGQAGLTGHLTIGHRVVIGAQSGVTKDVGDDSLVLGSPAEDALRAKKALALIVSLPEFKKALAAHERRLRELEAHASGGSAGAVRAE